jgi:hypothetical protein
MVPGVLRLVTFGNAAQPIPPQLIEELRRRVSQFNAQGAFPYYQFSPHDVVRGQCGPLRGLEAIFAGPMHPSNRVRILIELLGCLNEVEVDANIIERAKRGSLPKRARRTRGRGRPIKRKSVVM